MGQEKITILGGGEAGLRLVKYLREQKSSLPIEVVERGSYYFNRSTIEKLFQHNINIKSLKDLSEEFNFQLRTAQIERVNLNARRIYLKDSEYIEYNTLVIALGMISKKKNISGDFRKGVFYLSEIDPLYIRERLKVITDICVYAMTLLGIRIAFCFAQLKKIVRLLLPNPDPFDPYKDKLYKSCTELNIDVYPKFILTEIIGDSTVKAVRTNIPKVFAANLVILDTGFIPNTDLFSSKVELREDLTTNFDNVFHLGEIGNPVIEQELFFLGHSKIIEQQAQNLASYFSENNELSKVSWEYLQERDKKIEELFNKAFKLGGVRWLNG